MTNSVNLREALLRQDKWTPDERTKYEKEIINMIKTPLTPTSRLLTIGGCILGLGVGVGLSLLFFQENVFPLTTIALGLMAIGGFNMALYCASILYSGGKSRIRHGLWHSLHLTAFSTLFLVLAMLKAALVEDMSSGEHLVVIVAFLQWIPLGILPVALWKLQMSKLEQRQAELLSQVGQ